MRGQTRSWSILGLGESPAGATQGDQASAGSILPLRVPTSWGWQCSAVCDTVWRVQPICQVVSSQIPEAKSRVVHAANDDSADPTPSFGRCLPGTNPFAFRTVCRFRDDYKRRRRRGPEGVAHSTWFIPTESSGPPPADLRWRARIPFPVGVECWRRGPFGAVVANANQLRPTLEAP
jgi:hypothetical protein